MTNIGLVYASVSYNSIVTKIGLSSSATLAMFSSATISAGRKNAKASGGTIYSGKLTVEKKEIIIFRLGYCSFNLI